MATQLYPHITADAAVLSGQPVIEGTSVPVGLVVSQIAAGKSLRDVAAEHSITAEDVRAALEYAARRASEPPLRAPQVAGEATTSTSDLPRAAIAEARMLGMNVETISPLGRDLLAIRSAGIASGEQPISTWEDLDAEIADRRGGAYSDSDE